MRSNTKRLTDEVGSGRGQGAEEIQITHIVVNLSILWRRPIGRKLLCALSLLDRYRARTRVAANIEPRTFNASFGAALRAA